MKPAVNLLLDSGAFSAWFHKDSIDLKSYIEFIQRNMPLIAAYVSLDTIPGKGGVMDRSQSEIEESARASSANHRIMQKEGLAPIPVFHQGERFYWLEKMIEEGEPYIGVSPYLRSSVSDIIAWMDKCFTLLTDSEGRPVAKTHGFGVTGYRAMIRYPWFSVDSTTWAIAPGYGILKIPVEGVDGKPDFKIPPRQVYLSGADTKNKGAAHFDALSEHEQDWARKFIADCGYTVTDARNSYPARQNIYIKYFQMVEKYGATRVFEHRRGTFGAARKVLKLSDHKMRIFLATGIHLHHQSSTLTSCGVKNRLLSYFLLRHERGEAALAEYVQKGLVGQDRFLLKRTAKPNWAREHYKYYRRRAAAARFTGDDIQDEQETAT